MLLCLLLLRLIFDRGCDADFGRRSCHLLRDVHQGVLLILLVRCIDFVFALGGPTVARGLTPVAFLATAVDDHWLVPHR